MLRVPSPSLHLNRLSALNRVARRLAQSRMIQLDAPSRTVWGTNVPVLGEGVTNAGTTEDRLDLHSVRTHRQHLLEQTVGMCHLEMRAENAAPVWNYGSIVSSCHRRDLARLRDTTDPHQIRLQNVNALTLD